MDLSKLSREQLEQLAQEYYQKWQVIEHNAELYLNQLNRLKDDKYGKKSESVHSLQQKLDLFDEADERALIDKAEEQQTVDVAAHTRKKKVNAMDHLPENIETEIIEYPIENQVCDKCGGPLHILKYIEKEELVIIPRHFKKRIHRIPVLGCRQCEKDGSYNIIKTSGPKLLFDKSPASIEFVSYLMDMKYNLGVPLDRIEKNLKVEHILFPGNTYARWMMDTSEQYLMILYEYMHRQLLTYDVLHADETYFDIFGEKGKKSIGRTYIWMYRTGAYAEHPIILYQYAGGRSGEIPKSFLEEFYGYLSTDKYAGYNKVEGIKRCLCHVHARRQFVDSLKGKGKNPPKDSPEYKVIKMYLAIFEEEAIVLTECKNDYDKIKALRNYHLATVNGVLMDVSVKARLNALFLYLEELQVKTMARTKLGEAISYMLDAKEQFYTFLEDGRIPLSNNLAEVSIKPVINVRKTAMFFGSPKGASGSSCILSLIQTAKANGLSSYQYICDVLRYMVQHKSATGEVMLTDEELDSIMPWNIQNKVSED